jgi:hypothetical protein
VLRLADDDGRNDPLKFSRFKRMPKVWRLGQDAPRAIDPLGDEFRVTVFLKNRQADRAERAAIDSGLGDLQAWCQATLRSIIDRLDDSGEIPGAFTPFVRQRPVASAAEIEAGLDIPDDPQFLREWAGIDEPATPALPGPAPEEIQGDWIDAVTDQPLPGIPGADTTSAVSDFESLIDSVVGPLREGRRPAEDDANRLAGAIERFSKSTSSETTLDRAIVKSLYRLSLETQVLITEVHPSLGLDLQVVTAVRRLQSAVGAVLDR